MDVSGINSSSLFQFLLQPQSSQPDGLTSTSKTDSSQILNGLMPQPNQTKLSEQAEMFAKIQQMASDDPDKFKATMTEIADKMESAAGEIGGSRGSQMLQNLAAKFRSAAETGDPNQLPQPSQSRRPGGGHHPGGGRPGVGGPSGGMRGGRGINQYKQQVPDESQGLLDLLSNEDDEDAETIANDWNTMNDVNAYFTSIREILNNALSEE